MIHSVVFSKEAKARFRDPGNFSERSIVQLKNKFKKDQQLIYKLIENKKQSETVEWFELKHGINVQSFQADVASSNSSSNESLESDED